MSQLSCPEESSEPQLGRSPQSRVSHLNQQNLQAEILVAITAIDNLKNLLSTIDQQAMAQIKTIQIEVASTIEQELRIEDDPHRQKLCGNSSDDKSTQQLTEKTERVLKFIQKKVADPTSLGAKDIELLQKLHGVLEKQKQRSATANETEDDQEKFDQRVAKQQGIESHQHGVKRLIRNVKTLQQVLQEAATQKAGVALACLDDAKIIIENLSCAADNDERKTQVAQVTELLEQADDDFRKELYNSLKLSELTEYLEFVEPDKIEVEAETVLRTTDSRSSSSRFGRDAKSK